MNTTAGVMPKPETGAKKCVILLVELREYSFLFGVYIINVWLTHQCYDVGCNGLMSFAILQYLSISLNLLGDVGGGTTLSEVKTKSDYYNNRIDKDY